MAFLRAALIGRSWQTRECVDALYLEPGVDSGFTVDASPKVGEPKRDFSFAQRRREGKGRAGATRGLFEFVSFTIQVGQWTKPASPTDESGMTKRSNRFESGLRRGLPPRSRL